jgi:hydroxymethylpyrimidine pyrophosphatase-like HAD family hydrolase
MRQPSTAWIFDVDGVLADPEYKTINEDFFAIILGNLHKGEPVALNTGRSIDWVIERMIHPLLAKTKDKSVLTNFFIVGEKGATWMSFDPEGGMHRNKDDSFILSNKLRERMKEMVEEKFSDCVFFDDTKETMISIEMKDSYDVKKFKERQKELNTEMKKIIEEIGNGHKMDPTIIATDIEDIRVGKALGTKHILTWLDDNKLMPEKFIAFGDSVSDLEMANELEKKGKQVTFVYVGDLKKLKDAEEEGKVKNKAIIEQVGGFTQGTLEYLNKE